MPVKFTSHIDELTHLAGHYIEVPAQVIKKLGGKFSMRLLCTINQDQSTTFQCGLVALGNGNAYITLNAKRMKQLRLRRGDEVAVLLEEDKSEYGMELPEELSELLKQDDEGMKRFSKLTPGKQRYV